ncbi:NAD kinase [bacterium SCSIO 12643]|nr:NAD kinase [bacterium SCSIO 12643]
MKTVAIFGKELNHKYKEDIIFLLDYLKEKGIEIQIHKKYLKKLKEEFLLDLSHAVPFSSARNKNHRPDLFISIGGDGTFLDSTVMLRDTRIPILGINTGRLGFLARVSSEDIKESIDNFLINNYEIEERTLIEVCTENDLFGKKNFALNELTIHKNDNASMIIIHTYVNGEFLNSYWADGLIISTPTGSTAYSLSVGGPIVAPGSNNFIVSPIAPHNLNVRPMVISDSSEITLKIEGRTDKSLVSIDSRMQRIDTSVEIKVRKAPYQIHLLQMPNQTFFKTLRHKLNWGLDKRN